MTSNLHGNIASNQVLNGSLNKQKALSGGIKLGTGTGNYDALVNKPKINEVELNGNRSFEDLGLVEMSNQELLEIANIVFYGG